MAEAKSELAFGRAAVDFDVHESDYLVLVEDGISTFEGLAYRFPVAGDFEDYLSGRVTAKRTGRLGPTADRSRRAGSLTSRLRMPGASASCGT